MSLAFVVDEEKGLVLGDRATERRAELICAGTPRQTRTVTAVPVSGEGRGSRGRRSGSIVQGPVEARSCRSWLRC